MEIKINLPDTFFSDKEREDLYSILNVKNDDEFAACLEKISIAALTEYKQMMLGIDLPSRADEIRQQRLLHLIKYFYVDRIPTEAEVSMIFQLPETRSRTLIQYTISRFHHLLNDTIQNTLIELVKLANKIDGEEDYEIEIQSRFALEELNRIIQRRASTQKKIYSKRDSAGIYIIPGDTMISLKKILGIN